ncbi:MAG: hypothetical protein P8N76_02910 [Pirellulaceae bacterium]|nr:hypothetical protein [Pirellulaceae bacterium]
MISCCDAYQLKLANRSRYASMLAERFGVVADDTQMGTVGHLRQMRLTG